MDDLRALRLKLSGGDLPTAESTLEVHRAEKGEDTEYLLGVAWLARGAALTGEWQAARTYAQLPMNLAQPQLHTPADYTPHREAAYALGTALEVKAQFLATTRGKQDALKFLEESAKMQDQAQAPFNLRARLWKRWNQIGHEGRKAPSIRPQEWIGEPAPGLLQRPGKPVVFLLLGGVMWRLQSQAEPFRRIAGKYTSRGVSVS